MRIGELSKRTRIPVRMLRYYEERGLLSPTRTANNYRDFGDHDVDRATLVSSLIRSGLPTRLIIGLLGCGSQRPDPAAADEDLTELFATELARLDEKIACLTTSRNAVHRHLQQIRAHLSQ